MSLARHRNLAAAAAEGLLGSPLRFGTAVLLVATIVFWLTAGLALSEGLRQQARVSVAEGADLYVTLDEFGRDAGPPLSLAEELARLPGVERVVPRIVGRVLTGSRAAVVVGLPDSARPGEPFPVQDGSVRQLGRGQMLAGAALARALGLGKGSRQELSARRTIVFEIAGLIDPGAAIWSSNLLVLRFDEAAELFDRRGQASDLLLYCRPGYAGLVAELLAGRHPELRVQSRELVLHYTQRAYSLRQGVFGLLFAMAAAVGILAFLVCSGFGMTRRRRQIAVLRVHGWSTLDVLTMVLYEGLLISLAATALGFLGALLWLRLAHGALLGGFFIAGLETLPRFELPLRFTPAPLLLGLCISLLLSLTGNIVTAWRTATIPPAEALR
jgi:ABC-type lipoprotein release transport system permease subunit